MNCIYRHLRKGRKGSARYRGKMAYIPDDDRADPGRRWRTSPEGHKKGVASPSRPACRHAHCYSKGKYSDISMITPAVSIYNHLAGESVLSRLQSRYIYSCRQRLHIGNTCRRFEQEQPGCIIQIQSVKIAVHIEHTVIAIHSGYTVAFRYGDRHRAGTAYACIIEPFFYHCVTIRRL